MSGLQIISKGTYKGITEKAFPLEVKEYVFARENGKKCLLLRFFNSSEINVTAFTFWLIQKDSSGNEIRKRKITLDGIYSLAQNAFAPSNCFFLDEQCVDFDVKMVSALSGEYEYRAENGEGVVRYPIDLNKTNVVKRKPYCIQRSKLSKKVKYMGLILFLAVLFIAMAIIWPFFSGTVLPVINNTLGIGLEILKKAWDSFLNMLGGLITDLFNGNKA